MADQPAGEKTEQATPKRLKEAKNQGQIQRSIDLPAWLGMAAATMVLPLVIAAGSAAAEHQLNTALDIAANPDPLAAVQALGDGLGSILPTLAVLMFVTVVAGIAGSLFPGGFYLKQFKARFDQFNLVSGFRRVFGGQALWQGVKSLLKTAVIVGALYAAVQMLMPMLMGAGTSSISALLAIAATGVTGFLQASILAGVAIAAVDVFVIMRRNQKSTRMTKQEIKDETKSSEGDPLIKAQRRSRYMALSRNRMIAAIASADVVIVNPTTYAVALKYEAGKSAPTVVAKGKGVIAARIREEAEAHGVPMVRDVPLARALHAACALDQEIPLELYTAVAMVLTFVAALKKRGKASGVHEMKTPTL